MPQNPASLNTQSPAGGLAPNKSDASGNLAVGNGISSSLNVTAAKVIKATPGRIARIINIAGTAGFTLNDCATTGSASTANSILILTTTTVGQIITLDFPCAVGIVISAVGSSGQLAISYT